jgi:hypothetical protein
MICSVLRHYAVRKTALSALPNEESTNVAACVSGITRRSDNSRRVRLKGYAIHGSQLSVYLNAFHNQQ